MDSLPFWNVSGRYISRRQSLTLLATVLLSAASGWWMDLKHGSYSAIAALFLIAAIAGICEIILLLRIPDIKKQPPMDGQLKFRDFIWLAFCRGDILYVLCDGT